MKPGRKTYNGHPSRNYWNVSLWINNDEGLYRAALVALQATGTRRDAASLLLEQLTTAHTGPCSRRCIPTTPDGAPYTVASIHHAMRGM